MPTLRAIAVLVLSGCNLGGGATLPDGGGDDTAIGADADEGDDGAEGGRADGGPELGPITLVVQRIAAVAERQCDLDGGGTADNAIADQGSPDAQRIETAISAGFAGSINSGGRWIFHVVHVDDVTGPNASDAVLVTGEALDEEMCPDADCWQRPQDPTTWEDDFSGEEGFWIRAEELDDCGEPLALTRDVTIVAG